MGAVYASRSDLFRYGLPRGLLANPGRLCASVSAATDTFELDSHGFGLNDQLLFRAESGGALPAPIVAGTTYHAIPVSDHHFMAAAAPDGLPEDLTTDGDLVVVATPLPIDDVLEFYSRFVDNLLPGTAVPLDEPIDVTVRALVAELSAKKLLLLAGQSSASMTETELAAKAQLERWSKGMIPLRGAKVATNLAFTDAKIAQPTGPNYRNWGPSGKLP